MRRDHPRTPCYSHDNNLYNSVAESAIAQDPLDANNHLLVLIAGGFLKFFYDAQQETASQWYVTPPQLQDKWAMYFNNRKHNFRVLHTIYANSGTQICRG